MRRIKGVFTACFAENNKWVEKYTYINIGLNLIGILKKTQKGNLDITEWINWFLITLQKAIQNSDITLERVIKKHKFRNIYGTQIKNERQKKILKKLLDGFTGNLTTSKWAKIAKCSQDTALRDIQDLMDKGILIKSNLGGRSTKYELKF